MVSKSLGTFLWLHHRKHVRKDAHILDFRASAPCQGASLSDARFLSHAESCSFLFSQKNNVPRIVRKKGLAWHILDLCGHYAREVCTFKLALHPRFTHGCVCSFIFTKRLFSSRMVEDGSYVLDQSTFSRAQNDSHHVFCSSRRLSIENGTTTDSSTASRPTASTRRTTTGTPIWYVAEGEAGYLQFGVVVRFSGCNRLRAAI